MPEYSTILFEVKDHIGVMTGTEDAREAIAAFAAKCTPQFEGR